MYLLQFCVAAVLVAMVTSAAVDVEKTVKQVQNILQTNSLLPRLSREEILGLLNDIRAEDAKSTSASKEISIEIKTTPYSSIENEITPATSVPDNIENIVINNNEDIPAALSPTIFESTTKKDEPSVMVVLPYTPRDGSSLQELYTKPPKVERVLLADITPKPVKFLSGNKIKATLSHNAKLAENKKEEDFPAELQAFLDAHGLKGKPGQDHFLLPLEGFKPLPPARVVDGTVQLPENILLTYDLISPNNDKIEGAGGSTNNFLYEPLRPEYPFELDTSSSEIKETVYPLQMPKTQTKGSLLPLNLEPIDYEAVKVIPLNKGLSPVEEFKTASDNEQIKRQANGTDEATTTQVSITSEEPKSASEATAADSSASADTGASIADLEDSFGGALPPQPGDSELPPPRKNGFYWMLDWNSFLEVGDGDTKVNIRFEPKLGDPQMFLPVSVP